ncbi:PREDICTED: hydroxyacylglutathione hydrolase, mitochondrial [Ceratosolen solmsi marchali]|uniref:hydroxyacylglutathione hydrolase n=1 Tax=Ceratosolen solmsi marchali TaxID=326594 RepID=A0AAJ6YBR1_9HYME|nr:PREDICTED: hydroxyacylglutathione hydrolase, mitochondrial [Ceratosolen solmsi marchali]
MLVKVLPALQDNLMYIIIDKETNTAAVIDPINPNVVINVIKKLKCKLTTALITHHHWDHAGGNKQLKYLIPQLSIYGKDERIEGLTCQIDDQHVITLGNLNINCLHTPCHTAGDISYYVTKEGYNPVLFTGDTLFVGGCGKFFEGTAEDMYNNLIGIFSKLPDETQIYCGHEYTVENLKFGIHVEPDNESSKEKLIWASKQQKQLLYTVPSTIESEKLTNPFMRVCEERVQQFANKSDPIQVMAYLREKKNAFKSDDVKKN